MSDNNGTSNTPSGNIVVVCITVLAIFVLASCVGVFVAAPDGANTGSLITLLLGSLAPTIAVLALFVKTNEAGRKLVRVEEKTDRILNGAMEAKVRSALMHVLEERLDERNGRADEDTTVT